MANPPIVAHVRDQFLPLSETFIYQVMQGLQTVRAVAVCVERQNAQAFPWDEVRHVPYAGRFSAPRIATGFLRATRLKPHANSMTANYQKVFAELRPALVHAHFGPEGVKVMDACQKLGIPLMVSFHGYDLSQLTREAVWRNAYKRLFAIAFAVTGISEDFRGRLVRLGCPPEKIHVIRTGVDPGLFTYRDPALQPGQPVRFFAAARLVEKKGTRYTLEALAKVRATHPHVTYTHVGGGPLEQELKDLAAELGIADVCDFQGAQPNSVVRREMAASSIFVLPSVTAANGDQEGVPVTIYEAMATGLPVLSTYHSGIPEAVPDGENGYLAPERDADTLAANMMRLIECPERWAAMARCGRARIEECFDVHKETAKLESIYQKGLALSRA